MVTVEIIFDGGSRTEFAAVEDRARAIILAYSMFLNEGITPTSRFLLGDGVDDDSSILFDMNKVCAIRIGY